MSGGPTPATWHAIRASPDLEKRVSGTPATVSVLAPRLTTRSSSENTRRMPIDFTLPPDVDEVRARVREFMDEVVRPAEEKLSANAPNGEPDRADIVRMIIELRQKAHEWNVWLPHMPKEWGGLGLGITAMAFVSAESARTSFGPFILNAQAPDEGNQHTLLHHANDEQKEKYLRPLLEGRVRSCFAMTEPEVAGSDPTGLRTMAEYDEATDEWVVNGHKWFISGAKGASFAILIAKTD